MDDIHVMEFARYLSFLEPMPPITKELDQWGSRYTSQKYHMYRWLQWQMQVYKGAYGREKPNESSRLMYNRFLNPGGLLWLAEALGEKEAALREAVKAAAEAEKINWRGRCVAFREVVPWGRIMELFMDCQGWVYDAPIQPLLVFDPVSGLPNVKKGCNQKYLNIIDREEGGDEQIIMAEKPKRERLTKAERKARGWEV